MNSDQIGGIVRAILSAVGGYFVGKGFLDASTLTTIVGAVTTLIVTGWSLWTNSTTAMIASVAEKPEVTKVVAPSLASSIPAANVTTS